MPGLGWCRSLVRRGSARLAANEKGTQGVSNPSNPLTVGVTGATGFLGRHAVAALLARGHSVRALIRNGEKGRRVLPFTERLERVQGDVFDRGAVGALLAGADAVVHTIGIRRESSPGVTFARLHTGATRAIVEGMRGGGGGGGGGAGGGRLVHVSALGTRPDAPTAYWRTKYESEVIVRRSGLDWTILRPSIIHGPDGEFVMMVRDWVLGRRAPRFFLPYFARVEPGRLGLPPSPPQLTSALVQPVHVDDVAGAIVDVLERDAAIGEVYPLTGPETLDWPGLLTAIRDALPLGDKGKKARAIPAPLGVCVARVSRLLGLADALPFGASEPVMAVEDSTASHEKARAHLGFDPRAFRRSVDQYAGSI